MDRHTHTKKGGGEREEEEEMNRMRETAQVFFRERERDEIVFCVGEMPNWKMSKDDGGLVSLFQLFWAAQDCVCILKI